MTAARSTDELLAVARKTMPSGHYLPVRARSGAVRVLVLVFDHDDQEVEAVADELSWLQMDRPFVKPIVLLNTPAVAPVRRRGFVYETAVDPRTWRSFDPRRDSYATYLQQRVVEMVRVYDPRHTVVATPGLPLPRWAFTR